VGVAVVEIDENRDLEGVLVPGGKWWGSEEGTDATNGGNATTSRFSGCGRRWSTMKKM